MSDQDAFESIGDVAERVVRNTQVTPDVPRWAWHTAALANPKQIGKTLILTTTPEEGWFRVKSKEGPWEPVVIWQDGDQWFALRGIEPDRKTVHADDVWTWCARHPISFDEYERVAEQGQEWSDVDAVVQSQRKGPPRPGSNEPVDEAEILKDQIESAKQGAEKYAKFERWVKRGKIDVPVVESLIKDDETAGKAQSLRSRLLELFREGETKFHDEKDPITKRGKEVDERWRFRSVAQEQADIIRAALESYETKKLEARRAQEDAARKAAEIAAAAAQEAELSFVAPAPTVAPEPVPAPAPAAPETTIKGSYGRAATIGVKWDAQEITDQDALYKFMREHKELKAKLLELAQRGLDAGHDVPGISKKERATVR
jgi:hypothetical protein